MFKTTSIAVDILSLLASIILLSFVVYIFLYRYRYKEVIQLKYDVVQLLIRALIPILVFAYFFYSNFINKY